ncbi:MAG: YihA family ribosome biogenesis GTP-binding protein [Bacteroidetes bacterium]|nr:MAG: YihA family ribosome biogenesis GTP-binding protein [Bacteroidota bacterium]
MEIKSAKYVASYPNVEKCPKPNKPEYAFIGRSNVGKSSLINMLCNHKGLALTSKKPGKTQMINYFLVNESWYLVDLPGYGYASTSRKRRAKWEIMIEDYLRNRENLLCTFILIDVNVPPQKTDLNFINNMGRWGLPFVFVFTKTDRIKAPERKKNIRVFQETLSEYWNELPPHFLTSSEKKIGREALLDFIAPLNKQFFARVQSPFPHK